MGKIWEIDDESFEQWMQSIHAHPVLSEEYVHMQRLHQLLQRDGPSIPPEVRFGRLYQLIYRPSDYSASTLDRMFRRCSSRQKSEDRYLIDKYVGKKVERLKSESRIKYTFDPLKLVQVAFGPKGDDHLSRQRRLMALQQYITARILLDIDQSSSEIDVGDQFQDFLELLGERLFNRNSSDPLHWAALVETTEKRTVHDAKYLVGSPVVLTERSGFDWEVDDTYCRFVDGKDGEHLPVILDDRVKDDTSTALKVIRKGTRVGDEFDQLAFTLVVMSVKHLKMVEERFEAAVSAAPFSIRQREDLMKDEGGKRLNPASSDKFLVIRYILDYQDPRSGRTVTVEVNLQLLRDYLNTLYSRTDLRHPQYRFKQLCMSYFPFRYPRYMFGIDWREGSRDYCEMLAALP